MAARPARPLVRFNPSNGSSDQAFHIFLARGATHVGEPPDPSEADRIEWVPVPRSARSDPARRSPRRPLPHRALLRPRLRRIT